MNGHMSEKIEVKCSYLEIYNETLRDLLMCVDHDGPAPNVREDAKRGTFVENCHEERVYGAEQTYETFLRGADGINASGGRHEGVGRTALTCRADGIEASEIGRASCRERV